jgi:hypothetical protein
MPVSTWIERFALRPVQSTQELTMPSKTPKQARTMRAAAHDPKFAKKVGIPRSVAKEFTEADAKKGKPAGKRKS